MKMNTITFLGDVFLPRPYRGRMDLRGLYVFNLEYSITAASLGWPDKVNLKSEQNHIAQTFGRLPAAVCLANNHVMDFGARGLDDTREELQRIGIATFGAGSVKENAGNPLILKETDVALLGYACPSTAAVLATPDHPGAAPLALERIANDIAETKKEGARRIVVSLHWGEEEVNLPKPSDVVTARRIMDAGADLIIGHHAHCAQPFERYLEKFIFYGLGNCIMPNLNEPSYFDDTGRPSRRFEKKQHWWNRRSLAVEYNIDTGTAEVRELVFDGTSLRIAGSHPERYILSIGDEVQYEASYRRAFTFGKLRSKVMTYVKRPRRPRARHLKSILAIAREVTSTRS
jgi:hypothetical protein